MESKIGIHEAVSASKSILNKWGFSLNCLLEKVPYGFKQAVKRFPKFNESDVKQSIRRTHAPAI